MLSQLIYDRTPLYVHLALLSGPPADYSRKPDGRSTRENCSRCDTVSFCVVCWRESSPQEDQVLLLMVLSRLIFSASRSLGIHFHAQLDYLPPILFQHSPHLFSGLSNSSGLHTNDGVKVVLFLPKARRATYHFLQTSQSTMDSPFMGFVLSTPLRAFRRS